MFGPRPANEGPKVTLDQQAFRALASEVRVDILKKLDEKRRLTVTDLSHELGLSKPTLLEHLEKLTSATLVKRIDEGRKWIYYELAERGRRVLHPERVTIVVALTLSLFLLASGFYVMSLPLATQAAGSIETPRLDADSAGFPWIAVVLLVLGALAGVAAVLFWWRGRAIRRRFFRSLV